jgi:hypothetical protein
MSADLEFSLKIDIHHHGGGRMRQFLGRVAISIRPLAADGKECRSKMARSRQ